jgi:Flp pilus assembly pilin Flp
MRRAGLRRLIRRPVDLAQGLPTLCSSSEDGQGLAEYALILTFVAAVCVGALTALGGALPPFFGQVTGAL